MEPPRSQPGHGINLRSMITCQRSYHYDQEWSSELYYIFIHKLWMFNKNLAFLTMWSDLRNLCQSNIVSWSILTTIFFEITACVTWPTSALFLFNWSAHRQWQSPPLTFILVNPSILIIVYPKINSYHGNHMVNMQWVCLMACAIDMHNNSLPHVVFPIQTLVLYIFLINMEINKIHTSSHSQHW